MKLTNKSRDALVGYSFIALWLIGFLALTVYPLFMSLYFSFSKISITAHGIKIEKTSVPFENYRNIFRLDKAYVESLEDLVFKIVVYLPIIIVISMLIAILLNQKIKFRGLFRSIFFLPVIISSGPVINELTATGATTVPLLEEYGVIEMINQSMHPRIAEPLTAMFSEVIMILWFCGVQILLFLAALQKISPTIYEAARIDGASPWESFWKITLPSLKNIVIINIVYTLVTLATFSNNRTIVLIRNNISLKGYGYTSAQSWVYFLIIVFFLVIITGLVSLSGRSRYRR